MITVVTLCPGHDFRMSVAIQVRNFDVVRARSPDEVARPRVDGGIPVRQRVLIPFHPVFGIPLGDEEVVVAVTVHIHEFRIAAPPARWGDFMPGPVGVAIPNQRAFLTARDDDVGMPVSVDVTYDFDVRVERTVRVDDEVLESESRHAEDSSRQWGSSGNLRSIRDLLWRVFPEQLNPGYGKGREIALTTFKIGRDSSGNYAADWVAWIMALM